MKEPVEVPGGYRSRRPKNPSRLGRTWGMMTSECDGKPRAIRIREAQDRATGLKLCAEAVKAYSPMTSARLTVQALTWAQRAYTLSRVTDTVEIEDWLK